MIFNSYNPKESPFGITYGQRTAQWWRWALSMPEDKNAVIDTSGIFSNLNQPSNVWFLAGTFCSETSLFPNRKCEIPYGISVLFPIINCQANLFQDPDLGTEEAIMNHVNNDMNTTTKKDCFINGIRIVPFRVQSDPRVFSIELIEHSHQGVKKVQTLAAADGYWVFLKPMDKGTYQLQFAGSCENGKLNSGANYFITVE